MDSDKENNIFLEHARLPSKLSGSFFDSRNVEIPIMGITGFNEEYQKGKKRSTWFNGEIISPNYISNSGCACKSHIEGIVTDSGTLHFLEQVNDFMAREGDCYEFLLNVKDKLKTPLIFEGSVIARINRNGFKPNKIGEAIIEINPFWSARPNEGGVSRNFSLKNQSQHPVNGSYIPAFWDEFIKQIDKQGYAHPYQL